MKFDRCPRCGSDIRPAKTIKGSLSNFWYECTNEFCGAMIDNFEPYQMQYNFLEDNHIVKGAFGGYGCHRKDEPILMFDGTIKKVQDIKLGDKLMGPDSKERTVINLHRGKDSMFEVILKGKGTKEPMYLNGHHILNLAYSGYKEGVSGRGHHKYDGEYSYPTINEYIEKSKRYKTQHMWILSQGVSFKEKETHIDPYLLGVILGDGSISKGLIEIKNSDEEIIEYLKTIAPKYNNLNTELKKLGLFGKKSNEKFIPEIYKINSRKKRLELLAGLIDTDGYVNLNTVEIVSASKRMSEDIKFLAMSLGIRVNVSEKKVAKYPENTYYRISLTGTALNEVPNLVLRKKVNSKPNKRRYIQGFNLKKVSEEENYYGFELDEDGLYIEAKNFSVLHNSGKSITAIKDVQKHVLITPGAYVAVIGNTYPLIERNFKKDFDEDFPEKFMLKTRGQKEAGYQVQKKLYTLKNGAQIELITADDAQKLRGLNATKLVFLEASGISKIIFDNTKSRIRNNAASVFAKDKLGNIIYQEDKKTGHMVPVIEASWQNIILESNPENNWIRNNILLEASRIQFYGSSYRKYPYKLDKINDDYSLHISATDGNPYLPPNYLEMNTRGKPQWEIERYYLGSFEFADGMVIPEIVNSFVDDYPMDEILKDPNVFVLIGIDYGIYDTAAFVFSAWDFKKNILIVFDAFGGPDMTVTQQAELFRKHFSVIPKGKLLFTPKMDAKSFGKRQANGETIGQMFENLGLTFEGAFEDPLARIAKMKALAGNNQIQIFRQACAPLVEEFRGWKWQTNRKGEIIEKPVDKNNHYIDALGFSTIELPMDLTAKKALDYVKPGQNIIVDTKEYRKKPVYTKEQRFARALDPLNIGYKENEAKEYDSEIEYDEIINKLSGI